MDFLFQIYFKCAMLWKILLGYKFHHQKVAQCCCIYYTQLPHVSALYRRHIQGVTSLAVAHSGKLHKLPRTCTLYILQLNSKISSPLSR